MHFPIKFKRHINVILALLLPLLSFGVDPETALKKFITSSGVPSPSLAVKIVDLNSGDVITSHNSSTPLIPASILKSVTTATLLEHAGSDWRYHTRVFVDGISEMGILRGNLIIIGCCDPTVNSKVEPFGEDIIDEIVNTLNFVGINKIEGKIIVDESEYNGSSRPDSWAKGDHKKSYGTGCHAFNFNNNSKGDFAIENPKEVFKKQLETSFINANIKIGNKDIPSGNRTQLLDHVSRPLDEIMRSCMMRSDNLFAESMLRTYGKIVGGDGSVNDSSERELLFCSEQGYPMDGVVIKDGSGLSRENRVTADFMAAMLSKNSKNPDYASFFPLAGQEGTLRKFLAGSSLDSYVAMKTGSMTGIQCYAGYLLDDDYVPTHVVVVIMNDITKGRDKAKKAAERMLLDIFADDQILSENE